MKIKHKAFTVRQILKNYPRTRDCDFQLMAVFWRQELARLGKKEKDFLKLYDQGKLTSAETIRRNRQKLQQEIVELRGSRWDNRKNVQEPETKQEVRSFCTGL